MDINSISSIKLPQSMVVQNTATGSMSNNKNTLTKSTYINEKSNVEKPSTNKYIHAIKSFYPTSRTYKNSGDANGINSYDVVKIGFPYAITGMALIGTGLAIKKSVDVKNLKKYKPLVEKLKNKLESEKKLYIDSNEKLRIFSEELKEKADSIKNQFDEYKLKAQEELKQKTEELTKQFEEYKSKIEEETKQKIEEAVKNTKATFTKEDSPQVENVAEKIVKKSKKQQLTEATKKIIETLNPEDQTVVDKIVKIKNDSNAEVKRIINENRNDRDVNLENINKVAKDFVADKKGRGDSRFHQAAEILEQALLKKNVLVQDGYMGGLKKYFEDARKTPLYSIYRKMPLEEVTARLKHIEKNDLKCSYPVDISPEEFFQLSMEKVVQTFKMFKPE